MAKLPTIKLRQKGTGRTVKLNQTDYARDIAKWWGWETVYVQGGDATNKEVIESAAASDLEKERRADPVRERWSGDKQRARDAERITTGGLVIKAPVTKAVGRPDNYRPPSLG